jgi:hypothetical protein
VNGPRAVSTGHPKFVMVGVDRPGGGVRLYASREIPERELAFALAQDQYGTATGWHIDAEMRHVLIIDKPTWGEAFAHAFMIWENADREAARELARQERAAVNVRRREETEDARARLPRIEGRVRQRPEDELHRNDGRPGRMAIEPVADEAGP